MKNPAYRVRIGSQTFETGTCQDIINLSVDLDLNVPLDSFRIDLVPGMKANRIRNSDAVIIELGYEGTLKKVMTGAVDAVESRMTSVMVEGFSVVSILTRTRVNQVYEMQTAGAIVKDLAGKAGISVKDVQEGLSFPQYVVDDTKDVYTHMKDLARKCGFDIFITGDGRLIFKKYSRQTPRPFKYGRDIIMAQANEPTPLSASVKVYGESPSSFKGADTAHWITKRVVEGVAGSGTVHFLIEDPVIRDKETADKAAAAWLETIMTPLSGTIKVLGNMWVMPGDTIEIKDIPDTRMNGEFQATGVGHIFNKNEGFVSTVDWVKNITISPAEPPLAAPPALPSPPRPPSPLEEQLESANEALEEQRLELLDTVETSESALEEMLAGINNGMAELDTMAEEMIKAAENVRETALEAAREALAKADELEKELSENKKKILDEVVKAKEKFEKYRREAEAKIDGFEQEITKIKDKAKAEVNKIKDRVREARAKIEEKQKELEDAASVKVEITARFEEKNQELDEVREDEKKSTGAEKEIAKKRVKELELDVNNSREKLEKLDKELQNKKKELDEAAAKIKEKEEEIEKEVEAKEKELDDKVQEITGKKDEVKKAVDDREKETVGKAEETLKKFEKTSVEVEAQIREYREMADSIVKEADEKFKEARKKAEDSKKKAQEKLEDVRKKYNEARNTVVEARVQVGRD